MLNNPAPESALGVLQNRGWRTGDHLAAIVADRLGILIWQKTKDGQKGRNHPPPIERPGVKPETSGEIEKIGAAHTAAEIEDAFGHMWGR